MATSMRRRGAARRAARLGESARGGRAPAGGVGDRGARRRRGARAAGDRAQRCQPVPARVRGVPRGRDRRRGRAICAVEWFGTAEEAPAPCAIRELAEETALALTADGLGPIGGWDPLSPVGMAPPAARPAARDRALDRARGGAGPVRRAVLRGRGRSTGSSRRRTAPRPRPRGGPAAAELLADHEAGGASSTGRRSSR